MKKIIRVIILGLVKVISAIVLGVLALLLWIWIFTGFQWPWSKFR